MGGALRRGWVVAACCVAACVAAIAVPLGVHALSRSTPTTPRPRPAVPPHALKGDVDGDGQPDIVALTRTGTLEVVLARRPGSPLRLGLHGSPSLVGLAEIGGPGLAIVTAADQLDGSPGRDWTLRRVSNGALHRVRVVDDGVLGRYPGGATAWLTDGGALMSASLDPLQHGRPRQQVAARTWSLSGGRLRPASAGVWCWRRTGTTPARPCAPGQHWGYDVGPHGDLPPMLPVATGGSARFGGHVTDGASTWSLVRATPPGSDETPNVDLVLSGPGPSRAVRVPRGWSPSLIRTTVDLGSGDGSAVVVSQEGGDSDTWRVYLATSGGPVELRTDGRVPVGGGFTGGGGTAYLSWISADGRVYTRIGTRRPGRYRVLAWAADSPYPPVLRATDLGTVCIDDTLGTYGTC